MKADWHYKDLALLSRLLDLTAVTAQATVSFQKNRQEAYEKCVCCLYSEILSQ